MKGVMWLGEMEKLITKYIGRFEILYYPGKIVYKQALRQSLSGVHRMIHITGLKKYHGDGYYIIK